MEASPRNGWFGITVGLILLVAAVAGAVWWFSEAATAHRQAPNATYDNPIPPLLTLVFGWPALVILGISLLLKRRRVLKLLGVGCLLLAAAPLLILVR